MKPLPPNVRKDPEPINRALAELDDTAYRAARLLDGIAELLADSRRREVEPLCPDAPGTTS